MADFLISIIDIQSHEKLQRILKKSIFICCEGQTELAFLKHIKNLYLKEGIRKKKTVRIKPEKGGSLSKMKETIQKEKTNRHIDEDYIFLDGDQIKPEDKISPNVWISQPCIEGFLLEVLEHLKPQISKNCKKNFEKEILNAKDKLKYESYKQHFTKSILEKRRKNIALLDRILKVFESEI